MKYLSQCLSRLLLLLSTSLLVLLCLNFDNVKAETSTTYKPTDTFISETVKFIKSHIQELPSSPKYVMYYDILKKRYVFYFSAKGEELHSYKYVYADAKQTFVKVRGKNVIRIIADNNQTIEKSDYVPVLDENVQNIDFTRFLFNTASLGTGLSSSKKFVLLEEAFNDGGMTNSDKGFMSGLFQGLINALLAPLNLIKSAVDAVMVAVNSIGSMITSAITSMSSAITGALTVLGNFILDGLKSLFIPNQNDLNELINNFREWFVVKFGALAQVFIYLTQFISSLTNGAKTFVVDLPPISFFGVQIFNFDYDLSQITTTYKVLYDLYYNFVSAGLIFSFLGYLTTQMETLFND